VDGRITTTEHGGVVLLAKHWEKTLASMPIFTG
jgi:hypothetical protein